MVIILLLQETEHVIIFRHAHLQEPRRQEELHSPIQTHHVLSVNKIIVLLEDQGKLQYSDLLSLLSRLIQVALHTHPQSILSHLFL